MKKIIASLIICFCVFWCCRIYSINQNSPKITYYEIGNNLDCGDLELHFVESHLDTPEEFGNRFSNVYDEDGEFRVLSICIEVTNKTDANMDWNSVIDFISYGFETTTWASGVDTEVLALMNIFHSEKLAPGTSQKIWFTTIVEKISFKDSSWNNLNQFQFYYVLQSPPNKIVVRLDV